MAGVGGLGKRGAAALLAALVCAPLALTGTSSAGASASRPQLRAAATATRPNIVLILTDDQRWDSLDELPATNARSWHRYTNSYVDDPMCCPSRASTLTGRLPNHTRVDSLFEGARLDDRKTFPVMLHKAGYRTVFAGKYLNGYPFSRGPYTPPGWDDFNAFERSTPYYRYTLIENRKRVRYGVQPDDYSTDVLAGKIVGAIHDAPKSQPLFVEFAPNAPHRDGIVDPVPAPRDAGVCADTTFPLPANFNASDDVSEPAWMAGEIPKSADLAVRMRRATCETLRDVDRSVSAIFTELARTGRLANTYVVFTSDNGFHFGEHRLFEKGDLYEESVRVPLLVRGPGVVSGDDPRLTSNIDLAPTFLAWAHVTPPAHFFDGASFAASARGRKVPGPKGIVLRGCRTGSTPSTGNSACGGNPTNMGKNWGLRTDRYKYVEYPDGYRQLFDLVADTGEVHNLAPDPAYASTLTALHDQLVAQRRS